MIVTFRTWEIILNEEFNELKLKFANSQKVIFHCDLECIAPWPDLISFLFGEVWSTFDVVIANGVPVYDQKTPLPDFWLLVSSGSDPYLPDDLWVWVYTRDQ